MGGLSTPLKLRSCVRENTSGQSAPMDYQFQCRERNTQGPISSSAGRETP